MASPSWLYLALFGVVILSAPIVQADDSVEELYQRLNEGGDVAKQAAFKLFRRGDQDARLRAILRNEAGTTKPGSRLCILESLTYGALAQGDPTRPQAARKLAFEALDDSEGDVAKLAVRTFVNIEDEGTYTFVGRMLKLLRFASLESDQGKQALGLVEALERMRNSQRATEVLARVLDDRLGPELESLVQDALERMTAQRFRSPKQWLNWTERVHNLTLDEWTRDVAARRATRFQNYENAAEGWFKTLLAAVDSDPEQLLDVLRRGLEQTTNLSVRKRAVLELARMGRVEGGAEGKLRERAVALLRSQLPPPGEASPYYDEIQALVIQNLGTTGDPALLPEISRFLTATSSRMRAASARALGTLKAPEATEPLLAQLKEAQRQIDSDPFLIEAIVEALGRIGHNRTKDGETVAEVLIAFCRETLAKEDEDRNSLDLTRAAEALGKLRYEDPAELDMVVRLLSELSTAADPKVRFSVVSALGPLNHPDCFAVLKGRMSEESEQYIRRAVLDAVGLQAVLNKALAPEAISLLVPYLFDMGDADGLRRRSFDALKRLMRGGADFESLERLTTAVLEDRERDAALQVALPFLRELPDPEALGADAAEAQRLRYFMLVELRGWALLPTEPEPALADFEVVLAGRGMQAVTAESMKIFLGKGRAKLRLELPGEAFAIAREALGQLSAEASDADRLMVWDLALDAVEVAGRKRPETAEGLLKQLEPHAANVPLPLSERFKKLRVSK